MEHEDPLIDEVRQRRRELLASCKNDLRQLLALVQQRQREHPGQPADRRKQASTT
jgi:hypothetical protein